ncbi:MAG: exodeoxyribonuclease III [Oscillospiraceae bacterium]
MKLISWNVNGLRACLQKGFVDFFAEHNADIFCIQETKMQPGQAEIDFAGYHQYWNSAEKKGYSGTAVFTKREPLSVAYDIGNDAHTGEGRVITCEYEDFYLVNVYTPNAQRELARIDYRMQWEDAFRAYLLGLDQRKPVVVCGDLNVAHQEIDLKNPKTNRGNAGFSDQERDKLTELLDSGFVDSFRLLYPEKTGAYTWWSYMFKARQKGAGWRIDYFLVSERAKSRILDSLIYSEVMGSDHCPIGLLFGQASET